MSSKQSEIYFDPANPGSFGGVHRFAKAAGIKHGDGKKLLSGERVYTIHKPARKRFNTRPYKTSGIDYHWQADLVEMIPFASVNKNYRYILTVIDIFSRYGWARPLKHKTGEDVRDAFADIFKSGQRKPVKLQTDDGKEFLNGIFQSFLKQHGISHFTLTSAYKAAVAERFNRSIKSRMWRYFSHVGNHKWLDVLPLLIQSYNASVHRSIGMRPNDVSSQENEMMLWEKQENNLPQSVTLRNPSTQFKIGDHVKISLVNKNVFAKGYLPNFSEQVYVVAAVLFTEPIQYKLKNLMGKDVRGSWYAAELQSVKRA